MTSGEDLRALMRFVPHNVAVLAVDHDGDRMGVTISSLVSLSLEPPLVGISVGEAGIALRAAAARRHVRREPPRRRAGRDRASLRLRPAADRALGGRRIREGQFAPLIDGALGWIEARTRAEHDAGDHTFFIADVVSVERGPAQSALMYRDRSYHPL